MDTTLQVRPYRKLKDLTLEEKEDHRRAQLRASQLRYREKNGLIKPKEDSEEKIARRKEKARERYQATKEEVKTTPTTYTVDHQRQYHRAYYEKNKAKLLARSKEYAMKKKQID